MAGYATIKIEKQFLSRLPLGTEEEKFMLIVALTAIMVAFLFVCDYLVDAEKVFHVEPFHPEVFQLQTFTTIQALVLNK